MFTVSVQTYPFKYLQTEHSFRHDSLSNNLCDMSASTACLSNAKEKCGAPHIAAHIQHVACNGYQ
jgi:hypothetical protein